MDDRRLDEDLAGVMAGLAGRRGPCPDPDRLIALQGGELEGEARAEVQSHVALCAACTTLVERLAEAGARDDEDEVGWARARKNLDRRPLPFQAKRIRRPWSLGAAAAAVVAAAGIAFWVTRPEPASAPVIRAAPGLRGVTPAGDVTARELEFRWSAPSIHDRFRLEVAEEDTVIERRTVGPPPFSPDPALTGRLQAGHAYRWRVEALGPAGRPLDATPWTRFRLTP